MAEIGIDLGTTNSLVAHWTEDGAVIIPNVLGANLTPSVVSVDENDAILVGQVAKERMITHPQRTASSFKRYMGAQKVYRLGKHTFTPEELSSFVLKSLKADAEAYLGHAVEEAVISVPAYFNDMQRTATKRAAELAGLKVERLISEPTAAALSYGLHQRDSETKFMVFDLGGGTFDVSVLELFEGVMEVKAIAGDNYLGGEDFTGLFISKFAEHGGLDLTRLDHKGQAALYKQAELCKKALSDQHSGEMRFVHNGETITRTFDRDEYERMASQLLLRLRHPVERAMRDVSVSPRDLDAVILIGGATRMPVIRSTVGRMFCTLPFTSINPDEAVALGAAVQAALKRRDSSLEEMILTDVCPYTMGVEVVKQLGKDQMESGYFSPIIDRNTPIPVSRVQTFTTVQDNQSLIGLKVFQGESRKTEDNVRLGELDVAVPRGKAGQEQVDVRFTYDINGILEVEASVQSTGRKERLVIRNGNAGLSQAEVDARFEALKDIKIHPRDKTENRLLLARGERLFEEALGDRREYIGFLLQQFESVLMTQKTREIEKAAAELKAQLEQLEGWLELE